MTFTAARSQLDACSMEGSGFMLPNAIEYRLPLGGQDLLKKRRKAGVGYLGIPY